MFTHHHKSTRRLAALSVIALAAATVAASPAAPARSPAPAPSESGWKQTTPPDIGIKYQFDAFGGVGPGDMWAVGAEMTTTWAGTVAMHWDGKEWQRFDVPEGLALLGLSAAASDDVWAVGLTASQSLTAHWDGSAWTKVGTPQPDVPGQKPRLYDVATNDDGSQAWAVGCTNSGGWPQSTTAFAQVWDGQSWQLTEVPEPENAANSCLDAVVHVSQDQVYAVGRVAGESKGEPFIVRWDGTTWIPVETPELSQPDANLTSVMAFTHDHEKALPALCASGYTKRNFGDPLVARPLLMCSEQPGNGEWTTVDTPDVTSWNYNGLAPNGSGGLLVAGYTKYGGSLLFEWDGEGPATRVEDPMPENEVLAAAGTDGQHRSSWLTNEFKETGTAPPVVLYKVSP